MFEIEGPQKSRLEQIERDLADIARRPIESTSDPTGTHLFSLMELLNAFPKRSVDLGVAIRSLINQHQIVPATIVARALVETIAMRCLYVHDLNRLITRGDRKGVDDRLARYYAGAKGKHLKPIHVMDAIRYLEKIDGEYVDYLDEKSGVFLREY